MALACLLVCVTDKLPLVKAFEYEKGGLASKL